MSKSNAVTNSTEQSSLFPVGKLVISKGANKLAAEGKIKPQVYFERHARGDWGNMPMEDHCQNDYMVHRGGRLMSSYVVSDQITVWAITEPDRLETILLLPDEYWPAGTFNDL